MKFTSKYFEASLLFVQYWSEKGNWWIFATFACVVLSSNYMVTIILPFYERRQFSIF